ncbi:hypothetical protein RLIN73S_07148 [Rhodanobacter lindaniclasticus]
MHALGDHLSGISRARRSIGRRRDSAAAPADRLSQLRRRRRHAAQPLDVRQRVVARRRLRRPARGRRAAAAGARHRRSGRACTRPQAAEQRVDGARERLDPLLCMFGPSIGLSLVRAGGQPCGQRIEHAQSARTPNSTATARRRATAGLHHHCQQQAFARLLAAMRVSRDGDGEPSSDHQPHDGRAQRMTVQAVGDHRFGGLDAGGLDGGVRRSSPASRPWSKLCTLKSRARPGSYFSRKRACRGQAAAAQRVVAQQLGQGQRVVADTVVHPVGAAQRHAVAQAARRAAAAPPEQQGQDRQAGRAGRGVVHRRAAGIGRLFQQVAPAGCGWCACPYRCRPACGAGDGWRCPGCACRSAPWGRVAQRLDQSRATGDAVGT